MRFLSDVLDLFRVFVTDLDILTALAVQGGGDSAARRDALTVLAVP